MEEQLYDAGMGVIRYIASLDFTTGPLYFLILAVLGGVVCFRGHSLYKVILTVLGFVGGFALAAWALPALHASVTAQMTLGIEIGCGILLAVLSFRVVEIGIFIAAYMLAANNLVPLIAPAVGSFLGEHGYSISLPILSAVIAGIFAYLAKKSSKLILMILTAVIGGFALVNGVQGLLGSFSFQPRPAFLDMPFFWLAAKLLLSAAGFLVQRADGR